MPPRDRRKAPPPQPQQPLFLEPGMTTPPTAAPQSAPEQTRRAKKPVKKPVKWTSLIMTMTRLYEDIHERVIAYTEATGIGPQGVVERAINELCDDIGIPADMPEDSDLKVPRNPESSVGVPLYRPPTVTSPVRLKRNTRARLVAACHIRGEGGQDVINFAVELYLDQHAEQ